MKSNFRMILGLIAGLLAVSLVALPVSSAGKTAASAGSAAKAARLDTAAPVKRAVKTPDKTLLFFMNPYGGPCRHQLAILDEISDSVAPLAIVKYLKTTEPQDREAFAAWGIRGLPSIIITDRNGRELKRFAPGIRDAQEILAALHEKPAQK